MPAGRAGSRGLLAPARARRPAPSRALLTEQHGLEGERFRRSCWPLSPAAFHGVAAPFFASVTPPTSRQRRRSACSRAAVSHFNATRTAYDRRNSRATRE